MRGIPAYPLDRGSFRQKATRSYDTDGNLTRRAIHERFTLGRLTNAVTGRTVDYTQHDTVTAVLAVPGDLDTASETITAGDLSALDELCAALAAE